MKRFLAAVLAGVLILSMGTAAFGASGNWQKDGYGWWYQNSDGAYPAGQWASIDGSWYYFDGSGYMQTGWLFYQNSWYYLKESGQMATGWQSIDGDWYFFKDSGWMLTGWLAANQSLYCFDENGVMLTGEQMIGGELYTFAENGEFLQNNYVSKVSVKPYKAEWVKDDVLRVWCTMTNDTNFVISDISALDFMISNQKGVIAWTDFTKLEGWVMAPHTSVDIVFYFLPGAVYQKNADLADFDWDNQVEFTYYY